MTYALETKEIVMTVNVGEFMAKRALLTPDREGLVCEEIRRSFKELNERANRFANAMLGLGVGPGDRVGIPWRHQDRHDGAPRHCGSGNR